MNNEQPNQDFVIGHHAAMASLNSEHSINKVFIQEGLNSEPISRVIKKANQQKIVVQRVTKKKLDLLSDNQNHQGVVLAVAAFKYASMEDVFKLAKEREEEPFILILDNIEDPHNLGSILRTADAAGVHGIVIPKRRAVGLTSTVAKTSTGAIERVPVVQVSNLTSAIEDLKKRGLWIFGTDMNGTDYRRWDAKGAVGLVIGNEGKGISRLVKENVDEMLTIPMVGEVQSLNAGVAAGLLMYQGFNSRHQL
ncbi:23S rRNA (guanosine(2251)-2'-O)-methyltransferase RlmB [Pediococcus claussenii]|uniref:RNA 2'-O ribose methyltransferase substrate binding family protein n=1 Tax=Pediococcus claussenii (strain ATCC BAA-344 / DSM 14800 / JCM 18046 / KCTC 3811 / LMG 21948 / P06) TaxID=701521 RepID=G8PBM1_PEDCP|nr:23S rRNA (guanosine(2251)-2'-O)-methyltransferase RlmB [Pediococcus claussenii]AEV94770.1 RNA 2'-O ribose methyltransferase substrate binding family protein [Pediococcus claussenii ATCC BAA-344]KRN20950.1 hypothetical protein IV79_GL000175 [Pediococcus claussenii]